MKTTSKPCECGCGGTVPPHRHFCPGHDSRMLSLMLRMMYGRRPILGLMAAHPDVAEQVRRRP